jgi:hypothetical protein
VLFRRGNGRGECGKEPHCSDTDHHHRHEDLNERVAGLRTARRLARLRTIRSRGQKSGEESHPTLRVVPFERLADCANRNVDPSTDPPEKLTAADGA